MASLATLMYIITNSQLCPRTGACERLQDMTQSPVERKWRQISLPSAAKGMRRFSRRAASIMSPSLSIILSCGSILWLNITSRPPPPPLGLGPIPRPSNFWSPSSFCAGRYTHTGVEVNHLPLYTFFRIPPNSNRAPDSTSSMEVVLQECKNT